MSLPGVPCDEFTSCVLYPDEFTQSYNPAMESWCCIENIANFYLSHYCLCSLVNWRFANQSRKHKPFMSCRSF